MALSGTVLRRAVSIILVDFRGFESFEVLTFTLMMAYQVFRSAYRQELGTKLSQKPWMQELAKIPDWPRRKEVAEFRSCVGHDRLGTQLHHIGIRPDPYCMLCSLHETMNRNHLGRCIALSSGIECERYWEARKKIMEN